MLLRSWSSDPARWARLLVFCLVGGTGSLFALAHGCGLKATGIDTSDHESRTMRPEASGGSDVDTTGGDRGDALESQQGGTATDGGTINNYAFQSAGLSGVIGAAVTLSVMWLVIRWRQDLMVAKRLVGALHGTANRAIQLAIKNEGRYVRRDGRKAYDLTEQRLKRLVSNHKNAPGRKGLRDAPDKA